MNTTYIHTSDPAQTKAAEAMQLAVEKKRNEDDQHLFWQHMAANTMAAKRFGRNYDTEEGYQ